MIYVNIIFKRLTIYSTHFINILNLLYYAMRKSEKNSVAIFLAVALLAGTIAGSISPSFVDTQATEDKERLQRWT